MALTDKDIVITPNRGQSADPKVEFKGASSTLGPQTISLNVYPTSNGTLSFEGSAGQLFSITNTLTGTIYSVNDVSGIPSIEVLDTGLVKLAQYGGNVLIGTATDDGSKLQVRGSLRVGNGGWGSSPASTTFSHTIAANTGTNRTVNFDGNGTTPSVWWTSGSRAYGAIDAQDPGLTFWANNGSGWQKQITMGYGTVNIDTALQQGGNQVLHAGNYTSYSPTLTGGSASGTWGISITGNAATITSQANSATINASVGVTANDIVRRSNEGYIYANHVNFNTGVENPTIANFITDNGDGWSRKSSLAHVKNSIRGVADGTWGISITGSAGSAGWSTYSQILDTRAGQYTPNAYEDNRATFEFTDQIVSGWHSAMTLQGWSNGYAAWQIIGGATTSTHENWYLRSGVNTTWGSLRTILHSGNYTSYSPTLTGGSASGTWGISITGNADTVDNYHVAVAGSANTIPTRNGSGYLEPNNWIQFNGTYGLYAPTNDAHFHPNDQDYGSWRIRGTRNGWYGIYFDSGSTLMMNSSEVGFHRSGVGWQMWWSGGTGYVHKGNPGGGTQATILDSANYTNYTNGIFLRAAGHPGYGDWNTFGNTQQTVHEIYQENFNAGTNTGSSNFPTSRGYSYGTLINFGANSSARAQVYISHAGNDLIFRGGWTTGSWNTWNRVLTDQIYNSYSPTLTGGGASGTWGINITGNASYATSAGSSPWASLTGSYRENYDIGFRPAAASESYAGFRFGTVGGDGNAGYLLIRNGSDSDVYTQNGITLVADTGWLTLAQRSLSDKGVRIMSGATSTERVKVTSAGDIQFVNGNSINYNTGRMIYGDNYAGSEPYNTGSIGRSGINVNQIFERRSGFIDVWASGGTNTSGTTHDTGFQSMHYWDGTTGYGVQIAGNHGVRDTLKFRWRSDNGINPWYNILNSANYNSYSPTLTGGGASGTWNISITGSAGSATDNTKLPLAGGTMTGTLNFASADQSAVLQHNGNATQWYGRIVTKNSTSDRAAFLGTYAGITGVFAHNNALSAWAPLYVNTVDAGSWGGAVLFGRLQMDADGTDTWYRAQSGNRQRFTTTGGADFIIGNSSGVATLNGNQLLTAGNYTSYSPTLTGGSASGTWAINITGSAATATDSTKVPLTGGTMTGTLFINSKLRVNTASGPSDNTFGGATAPLYISGADRANTTILVENTSNSTLEYPTFVLRRTATPTSSRFGSLIRFAEKSSSGAELSASIFSFNRLTYTDLYIDGGYEAGSRVLLRASNHPNGSNITVGNKYVYYGTGSQVFWGVPLQSFQTTLDLSEGTYFTITISSDSTFAFTYPTNVANDVTIPGYGYIVSCSFTLEVTHTGGTITWPASVKWPGNTAPSLTTGKTHLFMFVTDDSGSRWRGSYLTNYDN